MTEPVAGALAVRPTGPRGDLVNAPAMTRRDAAALLERGRALGSDIRGLLALGEIGIGNTTVAGALAARLLDLHADAVVGIGASADSAMLDRKRDVITRSLRRERGETARPVDPLAALASLGGPELAVLTGMTLGAAAQHTPVVLDGLAVSVAALTATLLEPAVQHCLIAGQRSREPAHPVVLEALGCEPLLDLRIRSGEGAGAALATGLLLNALRIRRETARTAN